MTNYEFLEMIRKNGVTNGQLISMMKNPKETYLVNTLQMLDEFRKEGFYSDEIANNLENIFGDLDITLGQLDLLFFNYKDDLKQYLLTRNMNKNTLNLLKNNFYSKNYIARQFVKWINKWADEIKSDLNYLKSQNYLEWILCIDELELFRCFHCDTFKRKIESTLKDFDDIVFFNENKSLFRKQLYHVLNQEISESLEVTQELANRRRIFDKKLHK